MSMQHAQYVLLFLVLVVNSVRFQILRSYTLLLKLPVFMYSFWCLVTMNWFTIIIIDKILGHWQDYVLWGLGWGGGGLGLMIGLPRPAWSGLLDGPFLFILLFLGTTAGGFLEGVGSGGFDLWVWPFNCLFGFWYLHTKLYTLAQALHKNSEIL